MTTVTRFDELERPSVRSREHPSFERPAELQSQAVREQGRTSSVVALSPANVDARLLHQHCVGCS